MKILYLASVLSIIISFVSYLYVTVKKFGVLKSISASFYKAKWRFRLFIWGISLSVIPFAFNPVNYLILIGALLLFCVGVFARFRRKTILYFHMIGAMGGITFLFVGLYGWLSILAGIVMLASFFILKKHKPKTYVWWLEVESFILLIVKLIAIYLKMYIFI